MNNNLTLIKDVPKVLVILDEKLKNLKEIEETCYKCPSNLDGFGPIQSEMKVENLIRALSSVRIREKGYNDAVAELKLTTVPVFTIGKATADQWKHDIELRIKIINHKETFDKLNTYKDKMSKFLSEEDQKSILLKEMEDFLKI
jgi:hypothetical protein